MHTELIELGHKMKDTQSEIKQNIQRTSSDRTETRAQINDLEQKEEINIQLEQNEETRIQKNAQRLRNLWYNFKCSNIQIIGVPEGEEEEQEIENLFEKNNEDELPQSGKGDRLLESPGSSESQRNCIQEETHQGTS